MPTSPRFSALSRLQVKWLPLWNGRSFCISSSGLWLTGSKNSYWHQLANPAQGPKTLGYLQKRLRTQFPTISCTGSSFLHVGNRHKYGSNMVLYLHILCLILRQFSSSHQKEKIATKYQVTNFKFLSVFLSCFVVNCLFASLAILQLILANFFLKGKGSFSLYIVNTYKCNGIAFKRNYV